MRLMNHVGDGSDEAGRGLEVTIRIGPDGRLYFADITPDILAVAVAVLPEDGSLRARAERAASFGSEDRS